MSHTSTYAEQVHIFLSDRYGAAHFLLPVISRNPEAFFTNGDDELLQRTWATENGLPANSALETILLSQIEKHRAEVFYNLDPIRYGSSFVRKLPSCVKVSIAWWAAPAAKTDFGAYDLVVCNFPSILDQYRRVGWKAGYFAPAHDPEMDAYAANEKRPIDVLFVGGYSRHHVRRAKALEDVASLADRYNVVFCLDCSRLTRAAESWLGWLVPLSKYRRPKEIRSITRPPIFGRQLYDMLSKSKVVLNGAVDMAGADRGNMRCFEALGCAALMVSDRGNYPEGMREGETMLAYTDPQEAVSAIEFALSEPAYAREVSVRGYRLVRTKYSKEQQWDDFRRLVATL